MPRVTLHKIYMWPVAFYYPMKMEEMYHNENEKKMYHTVWMTVVTPAFRPKSVCNRCVIEGTVKLAYSEFLGTPVNIVAAFWGMHVSPAKHSYARLPRKCDYQTDRHTHTHRHRQHKNVVIAVIRYIDKAKFVILYNKFVIHKENQQGTMNRCWTLYIHKCKQSFQVI